VSWHQVGIVETEARGRSLACLDTDHEAWFNPFVKSTFQPILPGSVIGVLGSGQLGRMFAIAARRMGYRVHTFSPETDTPTGQVADVEIRRTTTT
jgi:phosphoglycerate dehydrogenase-like enzyme